jgi:hypothetical protein
MEAASYQNLVEAFESGQCKSPAGVPVCRIDRDVPSRRPQKQVENLTAKSAKSDEQVLAGTPPDATINAVGCAAGRVG